MPRVKSRNYAEAYKLYAAQVIPQIDPREIGSTFHGAVNLWKVKKNFRVCYAQKQLLISISTNLLVEHFYCSFSCSLTNR